MNRKLVVVAIFVSTLFLISSLPMPRVKASPTLWNIPANFPTITAALASPSVMPGDTIYVWNGLYQENPVITKANIKIIGQSNAGAIIESNTLGPCFRIDASGVTVENLGIRANGVGAYTTGVFLTLDANLCTIWLNVIDGFSYGVWLFGASNNAIIGNDIRNCMVNQGLPGGDGSCSAGVFIDSNVATGNQVRGNYIGTFGWDWYGVGTWGASGNTITLNNFDNIGAATQAFVKPGDVNTWDSEATGVNVGNWWMSLRPPPYFIDPSNIDFECSEWIDWNAHPWDINRDGQCNMKDIGTAARAFNTQFYMPDWNPAADITGPSGVPDGIVDMRDIGLAARHYLWTIPW